MRSRRLLRFETTWLQMPKLSHISKYWTPSFRTVKMAKVFGSERSPIIVARDRTRLSMFREVHPFWSRRQRRLISKIVARQNFELFDPCKISGRGGRNIWVNCRSSAFKPLVYIWQGISWSSERLESGCQQRTEAKHQVVIVGMTIVARR